MWMGVIMLLRYSVANLRPCVQIVRENWEQVRHEEYCH